MVEKKLKLIENEYFIKNKLQRFIKHSDIHGKSNEARDEKIVQKHRQSVSNKKWSTIMMLLKVDFNRTSIFY